MITEPELVGEGGAVIILSLSLTMEVREPEEGEEVPSDGPEAPGAEQYHADLISDMRGMKKLKAA